MQGNTLKKAVMPKRPLIYTAIKRPFNSIFNIYMQDRSIMMQGMIKDRLILFISKFVNISLSAVYILSFFTRFFTDQPTHFSKERAFEKETFYGDD